MRRILLLCALLLTILPATTGLPAAAQACTSSALRAGLTVRVLTNVNLRVAPGLNSRDIGGLSAGDLVTLIGGPVCANNITWWQTSGTLIGWAAESSSGTVYMDAAPVNTAELRSPLDGLSITLVNDQSTPRPADQCPPLSGDIAVNNAGVADPFASGGSAAFFVDGGFSAPLPALCIPTARVNEAEILSPDGSRGRPRIVPVDGAPDFVRATLPDAVLLQPGGWSLLVGDFLLNIQVTGPFSPMVDSRVNSNRQDILLAGFAPSEEIAILTGDVTDGDVSNLQVLTVRADPHGVAGANLDALTPIIAAVSESGLIAHPPLVDSISLAGVENEIDVYDQLVIATWGFEALGLPEPTPEPPTPTPEPPTATPEPTIDPTLAQTPTGIVRLVPTRGTTDVAAVAATAAPVEGCTYTVRNGDTFFRIALRHKLTTPQLREANPQVTNTQLIYVGDVLTIPGCGQGLP